MLENATRLCDAKFGTLFFFENGNVRIGALTGVSEAIAKDFYNTAGRSPIPGSTVDRLLRDKRPLLSPDLLAEPANVEIARFSVRAGAPISACRSSRTAR